MTQGPVHPARPPRRGAALSLLLLAGLLWLPDTARAQDPPPDADCTTPRKAAASFLGNLPPHADRPEHATRCFDWEGAAVPDNRRARAARQLKDIFDKNGWFVSVDDMPDVAEPEDTERVLLHAALPEVYYLRTDDEWRLAAESIRQIDTLHAEHVNEGFVAFIESLPPWMHDHTFFGPKWWQILGLLLALFASLLVRALVSGLVASRGVALLARLPEGFDSSIVGKAAKPIGTMALAAVLSYAVPLLGFGVKFNQIVLLAIRVLAASASVLLVYRLVDLGSDIFSRRAEKTETKLDDQIIPLIRKTLKVFVVALGIIFVLQNMDIDVGSLLAGASLGGLAFTLAAKDTVANLFGSVSIFADQPFQVGDWVVIAGHEGIVEEVGMRSTRIRTFYDSVISVPNSVVANSAVDNYGRRNYRRCMVTLGLTYETSPDQMQAFVEGVRAILLANPNVRHDAFEVHFRDFGAHSLDVLLYFFFRVDSWTAELTERQNVFLEIMRLAGELGVEFAFPTQTLHLGTVAAPAARRGVPGAEPRGAAGDRRGLRAGRHPRLPAGAPAQLGRVLPPR